MRKVTLIAALLIAGAAVLAQSDQLNFRKNKFWLSDSNFGELTDFEDVVLLNTRPRMILAKRQGETMICQMPSKAGEPWPPCWGVND